MYKFLLLMVTTGFICMSAGAQTRSLKKLKKEIVKSFGSQTGVFALAFKDMQTGETLFINEHEIFHAASTMKLPVLIEAYRQAAEGRFSLSDSVTIKNEFRSLADGSPFSLSPEDDSETDLYRHTGEKIPLTVLLYRMITQSSNLATNIVMEKLGAGSVMTTVRGIGAYDTKVLRGVEDNKAYQMGLNNTTSAFDLAILCNKIAAGEAVNKQASEEMIHTLLAQEFNDIIPARLPAGTKVAHKTGFITGIHHDAGIVFLPDGRNYVLVLLSKNLADDKGGVGLMADVSGIIYKYLSRQ
ncbi:MAG: serine hydrolase [Bacteroidota bacterium]